MTPMVYKRVADTTVRRVVNVKDDPEKQKVLTLSFSDLIEAHFHAVDGQGPKVGDCDHHQT